MTDPSGREVLTYVYDILGHRLCLLSPNAGTRRAVFAADGLMAEHRDARDALVLYGYDRAGRLDRSWARDDGLGAVTLREHVTFGDGGRPDQPAAERAESRAANRLGRPHRAYDEAGLLVSETYDFTGRLLDSRRRVVKDAALVPGWTPDWSLANADDCLDDHVYRTSFGFDALGRATFSRHPQDVTGSRAELRPAYNRAGALQSVALNGVPYIRHIAYNAKGQRTLVLYGNGVLTGFAHDPMTFRLRRLWTGRVFEPADLAHTYVPSETAEPLQDMAYDYDLVGNPLAIHDRVPGSGVAPLPDALDRAFTYDARYRLRSATGRECDAPRAPRPWDVSPRCQDLTRTRAYQQTYDYDALDNLVSIQHTAGMSGHTRTFALAVGGDRVKTVRTGANTFSYTYDANGNMSREADSRHFTWDHNDRLTGYRTQAGAAPPSLQAYYLYGSDGRRVKKLVRKQSGPAESTVCPDSLFEHHVIGSVQNNTLHVVDDERRVALVRFGPASPHDGAADAPVQYHLGDHLGSSTLVLGGATAADGAFVSREEYAPYGETTFGSHGRKRYRFSGKERDEESGLAYFGFRYYAPWLGRWASPDPAGAVDGLNLYAYVRDNPAALEDVSGLAGEDPLVTARRGATGARYDEQFANRWRAGTYARMTEDAISVNGTTVTPPPTIVAPTQLPTEGAAADPAAGSAQGRPSIAELRQERWEAAKSGMKNELIDMLSDSFGFGASDLVAAGLERFKDKAPAATGDTIRDLELQESFEGGKVVTNAVSTGASLVPVGEIAQGVKVLTKGLRLPKTHITYIFLDSTGIRYVGRAQGFGTPEEVLYQRLMKGHHVFLAHDALEAEVLAEHSSKASAMGGESVYHDYFKEKGYNLLNEENPLSFRRDRLKKSDARIKAFFDDW
ncbi:RHS repeat-associated core domain-containing protein [Streptomyces sp. ZSW22]|uniref:RHS repeat domain-containing protein n=1 Tax=Streptomyces sp. ZSW22 TaxID=3055050 RepID=UPI0025B1A877|nr:RHS repeat-associated core domain-containing protein [Streptomyces sp. ZSW22]MDN3249778.1 RHS repeat-associated core domain-containing protein [Streptomyces sp. ZSW22]